MITAAVALWATLIGTDGRLPAVPQLSGTWAEVQVTSVAVDLPVLGEQRSRTIATVLLRVSQVGTQLTITEEVCGLETKGTTSAIRTVYPPAFRRALSGWERRAELSASGTWQYREQGNLRTTGARLADGDALPTVADDPRVIDADHDGHPGLTVEISGLVEGQVYVVQRGRTNLQASLQTSDRLEGRLEWDSEEVVIGASHRYLQSKPTTRPEFDRSFFRRRRVPTHASCEEILARRSTLLGV